MADRLTKEQRSRNMSAIHGKDTKPELIVRRFLHANGYRFRLHVKNLPGKPDVVLPKYKSVIFVNGCFWHRHKNCHFSYLPKTRVEFWTNKFYENVRRDERNYALLAELGWKVILVWECEVKDGSFQKTLIPQLTE